MTRLGGEHFKRVGVPPPAVAAPERAAYDAAIASPRLPPKLFVPQVHTRGLGISAVRTSMACELAGYRPTCEGVEPQPYAPSQLHPLRP